MNDLLSPKNNTNNFGNPNSQDYDIFKKKLNDSNSCLGSISGGNI